MGKQCWSEAVLESGSWGHSVFQTPALVCEFSMEDCNFSLCEVIEEEMKVKDRGERRK